MSLNACLHKGIWSLIHNSDILPQYVLVTPNTLLEIWRYLKKLLFLILYFTVPNSKHSSLKHPLFISTLTLCLFLNQWNIEAVLTPCLYWLRYQYSRQNWFICSWYEINLNLVSTAMNAEQTTALTSSDHQNIHPAHAAKQHSWKAWKQEASWTTMDRHPSGRRETAEQVLVFANLGGRISHQQIQTLVDPIFNWVINFAFPQPVNQSRSLVMKVWM